jgi:uncharacterized OB-fold protein
MSGKKEDAAIMVQTLLKPKVYRLADEYGRRVTLIGGRCIKCRFVFFPFQTAGCETCGAHGDDIKPVDLAPTGTLLAWTTVHMHGKPYPAAPFIVGKVRLTDGPVVRGILDCADETALSYELDLKGVLISVDHPTNGQTLDFRFRPSDAERANA